MTKNRFIYASLAAALTLIACGTGGEPVAAPSSSSTAPSSTAPVSAADPVDAGRAAAARLGLPYLGLDAGTVEAAAKDGKPYVFGAGGTGCAGCGCRTVRSGLCTTPPSALAPPHSPVTSARRPPGRPIPISSRAPAGLLRASRPRMTPRSRSRIAGSVPSTHVPALERADVHRSGHGRRGPGAEADHQRGHPGRRWRPHPAAGADP